MKYLIPFIFVCILCPNLQAQTKDKKDIWREVSLDSVEYKKMKSYCQRIFGYYRYVDDGIIYADRWNDPREFKLYQVNEGICQIDVRYKADYDDGSMTIVGRNLVHPEKKSFLGMDFFELTPYTFLEKARRDSSTFQLAVSGDTTRIYAKNKLMGTAVRDLNNRELRIDYNALAPKEKMSINLLVVKASSPGVNAKAVYQLDSDNVRYVPQGNLKRIVFEGDIIANMYGNMIEERFREHTEIYVDSVVYLTKDEFRADQKRHYQDRVESTGYTEADIERLKAKLGVPPLSTEQKERIEDQRDWDDAFEHWLSVKNLLNIYLK